MNDLSCPYPNCNAVASNRFSLTKHLIHEHYYNTSVTLECKIGGCRRKYSSPASYRMHLYRQHCDNEFGSGTSRSIHSTEATTESSESSVTKDSRAPSLSLSCDAVACNQQLNTLSTSAHLANKFSNFCLKIREKYNLPFSTCNLIVDDIIDIMISSECMSDSGTSEVLDVWSSLRTNHGYTEYCKAVGMVASVTVKIDSYTYEYVPIVDNISSYLSHTSVFDAVYENSFTSFNSELVDFCCGHYFSSHDYFNGSMGKLRIHLYCDDIELCNPLGSSNSKNKLTCIYYVIGNIGSRHYSSLENILLAMVVKSSLV